MLGNLSFISYIPKMSSPDEETSGGATSSRRNNTITTTQKKFKGIRCRKWGKWVSEIRVPGTQERLWLGSYSSPEGAAVAHDVAFFCLRGPPPPESSWDNNFNFPHLLPITTLQTTMSPRSIQKAASDAGMAIDAAHSHLLVNKSPHDNINHGHDDGVVKTQFWPEHGVHNCYGSLDIQGSHESTMEGKEGLSISVEDYL